MSSFERTGTNLRVRHGARRRERNADESRPAVAWWIVRRPRVPLRRPPERGRPASAEESSLECWPLVHRQGGFVDFEVVAEGLQFPEGPIAMQDGSVIFVEIARGTLTRAWQGRTEVIAHLGGGPNGAAIGPDGAVYVCNNGGFEWRQWNGMLAPAGTAKDYTTGRIERVNLATGAFERVYESVNGNRLCGPNDIVFDRHGSLWFTDLGKHFARHRDISGVYYAKPDGSSITEVSYGYLSLNGVGLSPDEKTAYCAETDTGRLWAFDLIAPGVLD